MFLELTDLLSCPGCGPQQGLVLLVEEVRERRVLRGWLGCPRCRTDFRVDRGVADLRLDKVGSVPEQGPLCEDELAVKIVALTAVAQDRGYLLLGERLALAARGVSELAPDLEVIAVSTRPWEGGTAERVSRIVSDHHFPLAEYRFRGVAIAPGGNGELVAAAARRVSVGGRLVLFDAASEDLEEIERCGLSLLAAQGRTAVAERPC